MEFECILDCTILNPFLLNSIMSRFFFQNRHNLYTQSRSGEVAMFKVNVFFDLFQRKLNSLPVLLQSHLPSNGIHMKQQLRFGRAQITCQCFWPRPFSSQIIITPVCCLPWWSTIVLTCRWSAMCHCFTPGCVSEQIDHENRITTTNFEGSN